VPIGTENKLDFLHYDEFKNLEKTELKKKYICISSGIGPQLRCDHDASYNIAYSMFETSILPDNWIPFYNEFDEIWTPSTFCKKSFNSKDLKATVRVIPFGVDEKMFSCSEKKPEGSMFTFLAVGQWVDRKGWDILINAYTSEFMGDFDVKLCIKTNEPYKTKEELVREYLLTTTSNMPRILVNNVNANESMLPLFYKDANCYILPSRGEAFGIPYLEAMASGVPVIASDFGGQLDFINNDNGWLIPINSLRHLSDRLCKINSGYKNLWFAEPEIKDVRTLLRYVYENREETRKKGIKAREYVEKNLTWDKVADIAEIRLNEINGVL